MSASSQRAVSCGKRIVLMTEAMRRASKRFWLSAQTEPSVPRPTATPRSSISRTGAIPQPSRRLLPGLWATAAPASASMRRSSSVSQIECAPTKPGPSMPWSARRATMDLPQRRWLSTACTLDSARWVWMPTPYSRASAAQPSRNSSVAWFGIVGATPMRTRPLGPAVPAADGPLGEPEQALRRRGLHLLDRPPQVGGQLVGQARHGLVEDDVGDRRGQDHAHPHVGVGADHRLEGLVGDGRHRHVEVVGRRAAGLEHLDGPDRRREVLVFRRPESIVCRRVGEQVLERPAPGPARAPGGWPRGCGRCPCRAARCGRRRR